MVAWIILILMCALVFAKLLEGNGVEVDPDYDKSEFNVTLFYDFIGIDVEPQQLEFALQPTR